MTQCIVHAPSSLWTNACNPSPVTLADGSFGSGEGGRRVSRQKRPGYLLIRQCMDSPALQCQAQQRCRGDLQTRGRRRCMVLLQQAIRAMLVHQTRSGVFMRSPRPHHQTSAFCRTDLSGHVAARSQPRRHRRRQRSEADRENHGPQQTSRETRPKQAWGMRHRATS